MINKITSDESICLRKINQEVPHHIVNFSYIRTSKTAYYKPKHHHSISYFYRLTQINSKCYASYYEVFSQC